MDEKKERENKEEIQFTRSSIVIFFIFLFHIFRGFASGRGFKQRPPGAGGNHRKSEVDSYIAEASFFVKMHSMWTMWRCMPNTRARRGKLKSNSIL